jgi:hypothetical protein
MNRNQTKRAGSATSLPANQNRQNSPLNGLPAMVGSIAAQGFDNLGAGAPRTCGQYQYGGTMPIVAPAACVSPVVREVQL